MEQQEIFASEHLFGAAMPLAMWVQQGSVVLDANSSACELFGCASLEEFIGLDILSFLDTEQPDVDDMLSEAQLMFAELADGEVEKLEWSCRQLTGAPLALQVQVSAGLRNGERSLFLAAWDVSDLKRRLLNLTEGKQRLEAFIANFSHDLRSALFSILGFSEILKKGESLEWPQVREFISIINIEFLKISALVEDVLSISRFNAGRSNLKMRPLDLVAVFEESLAEMSVSAAEKGVALSSKLLAAPLEISGDWDGLKRVLDNLIDNALQSMPGGGSIELAMSLDQANSVVSVRVVDSGIGIPPSDLPFVFEKYYRIQRPESNDNGYGLGLAIAKAIIEEHGGAIAVESEEGRGTAFTIQLPVQKANLG